MRSGKGLFVGWAIALLISWPGASFPAQEADAAVSAETGASAASPATPEASAPPAPAAAYPELESQISRLKAENASLETREGELSRQIKEQDAELSSLMIKLTAVVQGQKLLNPVRFFSPALANAAYIFGALSLLLLVLLWPGAARKALSLSYLSELPARKADGGGVGPISNAARWFWAILAAILILLLMIPASAQEPPAPPAEQESGAALETVPGTPAVETPASDAPEVPAEAAPPAEAADPAAQQPAATAPAPVVPTLKPELDQALSYMDFTPLRRALYILENAKDGEAFNLALERELVEEMIEKAKEKGRRSVVDAAERGDDPVNVTLAPGKTAYCLVLASLLELDGQDDKVKPLVEKAIAPLVADGSSYFDNRSLTADQMEPLLLFAATYGLTDAVKVMVPKFMEKAGKLSHVVAALESAHRVNLDEVYKAAVSQLFETDQNMAIVKAIVEVALRHERKESAAIPLDKVFGQKSLGVGDGLLLLPLYAKVKDAGQVETALSGFVGKADFNDLLVLADTASSLNLARQVQQCLEKAAESWDADYEKLFDKARALNETRRVMEAVAGRLKRREAAGDQLLERGWPEGCGASIYEKEPVSLESYVAMSLYGYDPAHPQVQELLERVVGNGLDKIISTYGVEPLLPINDLYALVHYYQATGNPGQESSQKMLAVQRRLRGLDTAAQTMDDPLKLALQMEIDKLSERNGQLRDSVASKERQTAELALDILDARGKWTVALAEVLAKAALLLIALWIALVRATGAARLAHSFRFSHFFLTFAETIGFECCCTVVGLPAGIAVTLVSQDRLKHLRIAELPDPLTTPVSPPPIPVSTDAVPSPRVDAPRNPADNGLSGADAGG